MSILLGSGALVALGLRLSETRLYYFSSFTLGWTLLLLGLMKSKYGKPLKCLLLVLYSNLAFWGSVILWRFRPTFLSTQVNESIDPFALPLCLWLITFLILSIYEVLIFGIHLKLCRALCSAGLIGVFLQLLVSVRFIYHLVEGV